jgi:xylulose-5-phosphate/fructose-6-phosphate phosphoketolase
VSIESYKEEGSTTTPFDMMLRNKVSRYNALEALIKGAAKHNPQVALDLTSLLGDVSYQVSKV